jgi:hypothetical protein
MRMALRLVNKSVTIKPLRQLEVSVQVSQLDILFLISQLVLESLINNL